MPFTTGHRSPFPPLLCIAIALLGPALGCRSVKEATLPPTLARGTLRVGMEANWMPFEYLDEQGELVGFDVDLARELGGRLGVQVRFVANLSYDGLYDALRAGQVDLVISAIVVDPARMADFAYSRAYFDAGQVLVVRRGEEALRGGRGRLPPLAGRRLAVELGSAGDELARWWARRLPNLTLHHYDTAEHAMQAVLQDEADAAVTDRVTALLYTGARPALVVAEPPLTDEQYAIVLRREDQALLWAVNAALDAMRRDGTLEQLEKRWMGGSRAAR